jgi:UDP-N-acetylmuramoyl-tripeptide--D-alanyl-D-alanine ligase
VKLNLAEILSATSGKALSNFKTEFQSVGTDTRLDLSNQLFIALKGENFDAHQFLEKAFSQNAAALLIDHLPAENESLKSKLTIILVKDTLRALQDLGNFYRKKSKALVVGITGSNGKTTSKEFTAAILSAKKKVHIPKGSFNNHWGVPLTLLAQPEETEVSVIEMGMNHAGEITRLCEIADPDVVVCSMVGRAHIEFFGSVEKIAEAKEEIYEHSRANATRIYNLDNPHTKKMFDKSDSKFRQSRILTFSSEQHISNVFLQIDSVDMGSLTVKGAIAGVQGQAKIPVFGVHNLTNIMVAASCALSAGMSAAEIWQALPRCRTNWGRNQLVHLKSGAELLFDGYNANPDSMKALLENVKLFKNQGKKIGVFAQMRELGSLSEKAHEELGRLVAQTNFDIVWFYGDDADAFRRGIESEKYSKKLIISNTYEDSLASQVASVLKLGDALVVKGSRGLKLERFVMACDPVDFSLNKE